MNTQNPTHNQMLVTPRMPLDGWPGNTTEGRLGIAAPARLSCRLGVEPSVGFGLPLGREFTLPERRLVVYQADSSSPNRGETYLLGIECVCAHSACSRRKYFDVPAYALDFDAKALPAYRKCEINGAYVSPELQVFCSRACYSDECSD